MGRYKRGGGFQLDSELSILTRRVKAAWISPPCGVLGCLMETTYLFMGSHWIRDLYWYFSLSEWCVQQSMLNPLRLTGFYLIGQF